ncbi:MAG: hypothetical protein L3J71_06995 [Victivallaceae bacterium]|nr:hypothetical protein [Victivallaceae bacterium]
MNWNHYNHSFKQEYIRGYRYLDKYGEFLVEAERDFSFIPGEVNPVGGNLSFPDTGTDIIVNGKELTITQEFADDKDGEIFLAQTKNIIGLVFKHFKPEIIERNTVVIASFIPFQSVEDVLKKSLKYYPDGQDAVGKLIGMPVSYKNLDFSFSAGSRECQIILKPISFTSKTIKELYPAFNATSSERKRLARQNKKATRIEKQLSYGLMLETILKEATPPENSEEDIFEECLKNHELCKKEFIK